MYSFVWAVLSAHLKPQGSVEIRNVYNYWFVTKIVGDQFLQYIVSADWPSSQLSHDKEDSFFFNLKIHWEHQNQYC